MIDTALILAAGHGKRLWPLTENRSKVVLPIVGIPLIIDQINKFVEIGVKNIFIVVNKKNSDVVHLIEKYRLKRIKFIYQEKQLGTAHAVSLAEKYIKGGFYCLNADTIIDKSYFKSISSVNQKLLISVKFVDDSSNYGLVKFIDNVFQSIEEKKSHSSGYINAGLFIYNKDIFKAIGKVNKSKRGEYEITDALQYISGKLFINKVECFWQDIGYPWDYLSANERLIQNIHNSINGSIEENVSINGNLVLGKNSLIKSGVYIDGPVWIGEDCMIGPNAYLRSGTILCGNNKIGASSEIKNSIFFHGACAPHHNYVGDSIIGERCNLGAGTKIANVRLDKKDIRIRLNNSVINTGRKKLGVIMGDNVTTGINSSINPGTFIKGNSKINPSTLT